MTFSEYQEKQMRTAPVGMDAEKLMLNAALGLSGESGEVADLLKKVFFQGHSFSPEKYKEELGDVLWYLSLAAYAAGLNLDEVAYNNIKKLEARYPKGFDSDRSVNREAYGV